MKHQMMKHTRWLQWQSWLIVMLTGVLAMAAASDAFAQISVVPATTGAVPATIGTSGRVYLPPIGGGGGVQFFAPCPAKHWWLNTRQKLYPSAPATSFAALGYGSNTIWIDPEHDLVVVWRWHQDGDELVKRILAAVK